MTYRIQGLAPEPFQPLFDLTDAELKAKGAVRVTADSPRGFPCRVTLEDAKSGETLILLNHVSHDVDGPFRTSYGIYVREQAAAAAVCRDAVPQVMAVRRLALRCFNANGMLRDGVIAEVGEADAAIRALFERPEIDCIHAHNPAYGCFIAKVERG